jgi:lysophospholipase L1-like esterase
LGYTLFKAEEAPLSMSHRLSRIVLAGSLALLGIATAGAQGPVKEYLALGDSISFGYNPDVPLGDLPDYRGFPEFVSAALTLNLVNAACPGETSTTFFNVLAPDLGCHEWRAASLPLFVTYSSLTESQADYAVAFLRANPKTRLITITIGGNDLALLQGTCQAEFTSPTAIADCEIKGLAPVYAGFAKNLIEIYEAIRFKAGYQGPIVAANYASFDYSNALDTDALAGLNAITLGLTEAFGGKVADVFSAFQAASVAGGGLPCATNVGLSFPMPGTPLTCDPHPTVAGQQLIAQLVLKALK